MNFAICSSVTVNLLRRDLIQSTPRCLAAFSGYVANAIPHSFSASGN